MLAIPFTIHPVEVDETPQPDEHPAEYVRRLSLSKALQAAEQLDRQAIILAADTTVAIQTEADRWSILGKPADARHAAEMLRCLRGRVHYVFTGLALLRNMDGRLWSDVCTSEVPMRNFSEEEMYAYIASGDPLDKAGAYAIQHEGFHPVEKFEGCFANVMGLPLCHLAQMLDQAGISVQNQISLRCVRSLGYPCALDQRYGFRR